MVLGQLPSRKIVPNPKTNPGSNPNPNPNLEAIFLGGNCPDTIKHHAHSINMYHISPIFLKIKRKHLCWSLFLNKVAGLCIFVKIETPV